MNVLLGMHNHEVYVQLFFASLAHGLQHGEAERDVRHEHAIHHVQVKPLGFAAVYHVHFSLQVQEIRGQQRGGYYSTHFFFCGCFLWVSVSLKCQLTQ